MFDFLTGTKRPASGTPALPRAEVIARIRAAARPGAPWTVSDGAAEGVDLIAEWKIVDAQWYESFAKAGLDKVFKIHLKLDEASHEVRAKDSEYQVEWRAGVPSVTLATKKFSGQTKEIEFGKAYGFTEKGTLGEIYNYKFKTSEIKDPIQAAVTAAGWTYKGVAFGAL